MRMGVSKKETQCTLVAPGSAVLLRSRGTSRVPRLCADCVPVMKGHLWLNESNIHHTGVGEGLICQATYINLWPLLYIFSYRPRTSYEGKCICHSIQGGTGGGRSTLDHEPPEWKDQTGRMTRSSPLSQLAAPPPLQLGLVQHDQQVWKEHRARGYGRYCLVMFMGGCLVGKSFMTNQSSCDSRYKADDLRCRRLNLKEIGKCIESEGSDH